MKTFVLLAVALLSKCWAEEEPVSGQPFELDLDTFDVVKNTDEAWWVMFYGPDCKFSDAFAGKWERMANQWGQHAVRPRYNVAKFDCFTPGHMQICQEYDVTETPTFVWFPIYQKKGYKYIGKHEMTQLNLFSIHEKYEKIYAQKALDEQAKKTRVNDEL